MRILAFIFFYLFIFESYCQEGLNYNSAQTLEYINTKLKENPPGDPGTKQEYYQIQISGNTLIILAYEKDLVNKEWNSCYKHVFSLDNEIRFDLDTYGSNGYSATIFVFGKFKAHVCTNDLSGENWKQSNTWISFKGCAPRTPALQCSITKPLFNSLNHLLEELKKDGVYKPSTKADPFNYDK